MDMCKRSLSVLMALLMVLTLTFDCFQFSVFAADGQDKSKEIKYQNLFYYQLDGGSIHITRAVKDDHFDNEGNLTHSDKCLITDLSIPDTLPVGGASYPVEYIDGKVGSIEGAFADCFNLKTLKLPSTLKYIGDNAFRNCTSIASLQIPEGVTKLGCGAFAGCSSLSKVNIPKDCHSGDYAGEIMYDGPFSGDENLSDVTIAGGSTFIDNAMFDNSGIKSIAIPDSVRRIGANAFRNAKKLAGVSISKSSQLETVGWTAFSGTAITSIYLPDTVSFVDVGAFAGCKQLNSVRLSANMKCNDNQPGRSYDTGIFNDCTSLTDISFQAGIKTIGKYWFFDSPITSVTIPSSVTEIGDGAFRYCLNLKEVKFESGCSLETIGETAFRKDTELKQFSFPGTLKTIRANAFEETGLSQAALPDSLEKLYAGVFNNCKALVSVTIPAKMTYDGGDNNGAFEGCDSLKTVMFRDGVTKIDDFLFGWNNGLESIDIPEGVSRIGSRAFRRNYSLKSVTMPESLVEIGGEAFSDCTALETMTFKGSRPATNGSICENVTATVRFGVWDKKPDDWQGDLTFEGKIDSSVKGENLLHFDACGGRTDIQSKTLRKGDKYGKLPKPVKKGFTFLGWYTKVKDGSKVSSKTILKTNKDVTVYAHWKAHVYNVKFSKNGGSGIMIGMKNLKCGKSYRLRKNLFRKKGYIFTGWSESKKGPAVFTDKAKIKSLATKNKKTVTLYAVWRKKSANKSYTIYYDANGGTGKMAPSKTKTNETCRLRKNTFELKGHTFVGWSKYKNGSVKYGNRAAVRALTSKQNGKVTLFAVWVKKTDSAKIKRMKKNTPKVNVCVISGCNEKGNGYTWEGAVDFGKIVSKSKISGYTTEGRKLAVQGFAGAAPSRQDLEDCIINTLSDTTDKDLSIIYYAGHGARKDQASNGIGIRLSDDSFKDYYSFADFLKLLNYYSNGKIVLIVDSCFSGGFVKAVKSSPIKNRICILASSEIDQSTYGTYKSIQGGGVLAPANAMTCFLLDFVTDKGRTYQCFTYALNKGLRKNTSGKYPADLNKDRTITCEELYAYINSTLFTYGGDMTQKPQCYLGKLKDQIIVSY